MPRSLAVARALLAGTTLAAALTARVEESRTALAAAPARDTTARDTTARDTTAARRLARVDSLSTPESAQYDAETDRWFVTNVGRAGVADGFLTRLDGDGRVEEMRFVAHGERGATLESPRGLAIQGDTLWVADDRALRAFHKRTGAALGAVDLAPLGAMILNDVAVAPDGALYVTDSGIRREDGRWRHVGPDRVFVVRGRAAAEHVGDAAIDYPNGVFVDAARDRLIVTEVGDSVIHAWTARGRGEEIARGPGGYDGVVVLPDGRTLVSSWADSSVHVVDGARLRPIIHGVRSPADIGVDARRGRVGIPSLAADAFELWELKR